MAPPAARCPWRSNRAGRPQRATPVVSHRRTAGRTLPRIVTRHASARHRDCVPCRRRVGHADFPSGCLPGEGRAPRPGRVRLPAWQPEQRLTTLHRAERTPRDRLRAWAGGPCRRNHRSYHDYPIDVARCFDDVVAGRRYDPGHRPGIANDRDYHDRHGTHASCRMSAPCGPLWVARCRKDPRTGASASRLPGAAQARGAPAPAVQHWSRPAQRCWHGYCCR
jgi:hypothetical protein